MVSVGGEERTIEFMESQTVITASTPLLEDAYTYGVVEHPFPLNWFLKDWILGPKFYHAVKIGIVQYVCVYISEKFSLLHLLLLKFYSHLMFIKASFFQMILKMICALLAMILESFGVYGEGKFEWKYG